MDHGRYYLSDSRTTKNILSVYPLILLTELGNYFVGQPNKALVT